jgi:pimeloyl-ACP methyl ester carboxylesterase
MAMRKPITTRSVLVLIRRLWVTSGVLVLLLMPVYVWWTYTPRLPVGALASDDTVLVERRDVLRFVPRGDARSVGLVWVAGCLVSPDAYAPLGHAVAAQGYPVVVYGLPWRCTPWAPQRAQAEADIRRLLASAPPDRWVLGGHSKGAVFVSNVAATPPPSLRGVIIAGSTHPRDVDLSGSPLPIMKVVATLDGIAPMAVSESRRVLLPATVDWRRIEGGNHSQFGWYGRQLGDGRPTLSRGQQQEQMLSAVLAALKQVERP